MLRYSFVIFKYSKLEIMGRYRKCDSHGRSIKRTASAASYGSAIKEAKQYSLIRVVVAQTEKALEVLKKVNYWVNTTEVLS